MRSPTGNLEYALTFRNDAGMDITKRVFGGQTEPKHIRMWLCRNLKREFLEKGIIKSKDATLTLMWNIPKDKQQGKKRVSKVLGPLHNIEGTLRANRDFVDFTTGMCVIVGDSGAPDNDIASEAETEEDQTTPTA
ncbi:hypothetical protein IWW47_003109 [Coemansia sp. RSA 2052]|nr:hypothetical protein IWW47_003109 [Coemansia sp. RSA 2052]